MGLYGQLSDFLGNTCSFKVGFSQQVLKNITARKRSALFTLTPFSEP